jgi:hypothetical protein
MPFLKIFDTDLHAYFHCSVGVEWNDDLSFAAATFYLDALRDQPRQQIVAITTQRGISFRCAVVFVVLKLRTRLHSGSLSL